MDVNEQQPVVPRPPPLPFSKLRDHGLLWLINKAVFHPRGFALAFTVEDDGTVTGWSMQGDGTESWHYDNDPAGDWSEDVAFAAVESFLNSCRPSAGEPQ